LLFNLSRASVFHRSRRRQDLPDLKTESEQVTFRSKMMPLNSLSASISANLWNDLLKKKSCRWQDF
jgi:hypothetical protein